jgi:hypoxanthine phosphoribosyltransferase
MKSQPGLSVIVIRDEIAAMVKKLADEITQDYLGKNPLLVGILKGSFMFMADLVRLLDMPLEIEFVRLSSYGKGTESSGRIETVQGIRTDVADRDVLVIEDIIDTGLTTSFLLDYLQKKHPRSLKLCALTEKPARRKVPVAIDYIGFTLPDRFVVGYGLDCNEKYRNLPDICVLENQ